jgi:hypothetical protein
MAHLIRKDPVTCDLYFSHRFHQLITWKGKNGPFGNHELYHFYYRIRFQHRGISHVRVPIWFRNAHLFEDTACINSVRAIQQLRDELIACTNTDMTDLIPVQTHKHTATCQLNKKQCVICRAGIPFLPLDEI